MWGLFISWRCGRECEHIRQARDECKLTDENATDGEKPEYWPEGTSAQKARLMLLGPQLALLAMALAAATYWDIDVFGRFSWSLEAVGLGIALAAILLLLIDLSRRALPKIWEDLDDHAVRLFAEAPFKLTWTMVVSLSLVAGVIEEIVFRGVLQTWLETHMPLWPAILIQAAIFAALHPISKAYIIYVLLIGIALGWVFAASGNLLIVMVAHFFYDVYALGRLKRLAEDRAHRVAPAT